MAEKRPKRSQFERLVDGMVAVTNRRGYANASVAAVIKEAGVSRVTFYEQFEDREACLVASVEHVDSELRELVSDALAELTGGGHAAWQRLFGVLAAYAAEEPARARFLMGEAMAGGASALDKRDEGVLAVAAAVDAAATGSSSLPDLESRVVIGSAYRMLAARLRRGEVISAKLAQELLDWIDLYERPVSARRWAAGKPLKGIPASPHVPDIPIQQMPSGLGPGRPRIAPEEIAENQRLRILYATAKLAESQGYTATTVADITKLARVRSNTFYSQFADKQEAFVAVHEFGFQQVMDVTVKAFFSAEGWPLRSWEAGRAFTQLLQANPLVANVAFVEAYAVGPLAVQRIEDTHTAFLFFLQEGLMLTDTPPSRIGMEAIIAAVFEIIYLQARAGEKLQIAGMLPQIAALWLTPFLGAKATDALIDSQVKPTPKRRARAPRKS